jgi:hypothetical protein
MIYIVCEVMIIYKIKLIYTGVRDFFKAKSLPVLVNDSS